MRIRSSENMIRGTYTDVEKNVDPIIRRSLIFRCPFLRVTFFKRHGKRETMVEFTGLYGNPFQNGSISKLDDWSYLIGLHLG